MIINLEMKKQPSEFQLSFRDWVENKCQDKFKMYRGSNSLRTKGPNTEYFSGPHFSVLGLNTIQPEYGKIRTRKNFVIGHFSRSDYYKLFTIN